MRYHAEPSYYNMHRAEISDTYVYFLLRKLVWKEYVPTDSAVSSRLRVSG